ncbi:hypothetical protein M9H77_20326 [Catharanthus roseus]|uniref:Uncharacterized protein n=1 Tax=Catharanthus roseus TaxID=4058 RepID=A0ACC0AJB5_CATRO|nr:hypothetical protein M9H77_20326 [Catharanthus roseus]
MEMQVLRPLNSLSSLSHNIPQRGLPPLPTRPLIFGQSVKFSNINDRNSAARAFKAINCRANGSGMVNSTSGAVEATPSDVSVKDGNLVFVAGATGRVGSRTVRELLKLGFRVRAGVRSAQRAESLVQSVKQMKLDGDASALTPPIERLEIVECDLEKKDQILPGLGNASIVICSIGASEKEVFDVTGPCRIDYRAAKSLIDAASVAKVDHFILVTSLGTNKFGFPAAILNLFWGVLIWKRKAEEALLASGLPYTIVRPGGMERPTDAYKETHNITLSEEDTLFGGQVSNLQVAELMAFMAKNRSLSYCKVVEVIAETTAPLTPMGELLAKIPSQRAYVDRSKELGVVDRPGTAAPDISSSESPPSISVEREATETKATASRPLSPYTAYEDLKPPTSPSPTPSSGSVPIKESDAGRARLAANSSPVAVNSLELPSVSSETISIQMDGKKISPSSPYTSYDDLKPPSSPTPNPPGGSKIAAVDAAKPESAAVELGTKIPLSPYTAYEDLKPPSSPSPTPSNPREEHSSVSASSQLTGGNNVPENGSTVKHQTGSSPFLAYADLKPPTSPSPNAPASATSNKIQPAVSEKTDEPQQHAEVVRTVHSPFTMYEDLKPPSSPSPSPKKL